MKNILLVLAFFITFLITFDLFLKEPPVWPDEASLAQMSVASSGNLIADYQYYPSIYIALLSILFHFNGVSIEGQRILSVIAGFICIIIFSLFASFIAGTVTKNSFFKIIPIILLLTDFTFLQATRVGRPEIFTLLFGLVSIYLLYKFISEDFKKFTFLICSFIFALLSFAFHIHGLIFLITILVTIGVFFRKFSRKGQKAIIVSNIFAIALLIYIGLHESSFLNGILDRLKIADAQNSWIITVFQDKPLELKLLYLSFIIISCLFVFYIIKQRKINLITIAFPLLLSWVVLIMNKDFWYAVYLIPFIFLSLLILLEYNVKNKLKFYGLIFLCLIIFISNLKFHLNILAEEGGDKYSYQRYVADIRQVIPENVSVFTSALPDPYYAFVNHNNKLTRFPQGFVDRNDYLKQLNEIDYVVYNGPYGSNYYGDLVTKYLKTNVLKITNIGKQGQYQAIVAELKPRNQRINP